MLPNEAAAKEKENQMLWIEIYESTAIHIGEKDRNKGVARYKSTKKLLMKHREEAESMRFANARAAMDVWLGRIAAALNVDQQFLQAMRLLKTADWYMLIGEGCPK